MSMRKVILFICLWTSFSIHAQEQLGLRTDNYAGIHGSLLNPSHNVTSLFKWDINLIGGGFSAHSNYGFIEKTNVFHSIRNADNFILRQDLETPTPGRNDLVADFANNNRLKYLSIFANAMGPSFMVKLSNGHTFGVFTNARTAFTTHDIPAVLNFTTFFETPYYEFIQVEDFKISAMAWSELGLNYAARIETTEGYYGIGANLKFINAYEAMYIHTNNVTPSAQIPGDTLLFQSPSLKYGVTKSNFEGENIGANVNGFGVGLDLGFTYVYEGNEDHYKWKVGASLLDLGQIELSQNAEEHFIKTDSLVIFPSKQFQAVSNQERIYILSRAGLADSTASITASNFRLGLPGALSVQGDYMVTPNFYVHGLWVQRIPMGRNSLRRNNLIAATPRFEHRWFGAALPLVLVNYQKLNLGTSIRIGFLTIGSDDVTSFFGKRKLDSTDIYFALKINPFDLGLDLGGSGRRGRKGVKCYDF